MQIYPRYLKQRLGSHPNLADTNHPTQTRLNSKNQDKPSSNKKPLPKQHIHTLLRDKLK